MSFTEAQSARLAMRRSEWTGPTVHHAPHYVQANLVVLPQAYAYDFLLYCQRNPKACPLLEVTDPGCYEPRMTAPGADLRTDLPRYAVYRHGQRMDDVLDILDLWRDDSVAFLIGSSLTFDEPLARAGIPQCQSVWVLQTSLTTVRAGLFHGQLVVSMRWMTPGQAIVAAQLTARYPFNHGAPIHIGDPAEIGADLAHPIFGEPVASIPDGIMPVFWACGVTPQLAVLNAKPDLFIAQAPGHGFITDLLVDRICTP